MVYPHLQWLRKVVIPDLPSVQSQEYLCQMIIFTSTLHVIWHSAPFSPLTLQAELKKDLIPLKKNLRCLYEAKQECDDTTVHIKVSINKHRDPRNTRGPAWPLTWLWLKFEPNLLVCKHVSRGVTEFVFREQSSQIWVSDLAVRATVCVFYCLLQKQELKVNNFYTFIKCFLGFLLNSELECPYYMVYFRGILQQN